MHFDLSLLSPSNSELFKNVMPNGALFTISLKFKLFIKCHNNIEKIKSSLWEELLHLSSSWAYFNISVIEEYNIIYYEVNEDTEHEEESDPYNIIMCRSYQNCPLYCYYKALIKYNLFFNTFRTLMLTYQFLLTLPMTQIPSER